MPSNLMTNGIFPVVHTPNERINVNPRLFSIALHIRGGFFVDQKTGIRVNCVPKRAVPTPAMIGPNGLVLPIHNGYNKTKK